ncbi:MAG TPA: DUF4229 domain-containing protein [Streptomyces sp.]|nr:DUF4229 domain-containing protein [Streptomyces sp.]
MTSTSDNTPDKAPASAPGRTSHATLRYTAMRLGLFVASFVVVAVLAYVGVIPESIGRANPLWLILLALVISAPLSLVLLRRQRDEMSVQIADRVERAKQKLAANQSQED